MLTKFYNDIYYSNKDIATIGGVTDTDLNQIESYLLELIDYKLFISQEEFSMYEQGLHTHFSTNAVQQASAADQAILHEMM